MDIYVVKQGDTLFQIAKRFGVDLKRLMSDNGLGEENTLVVGQSLIIRYPDMVYTVKSGDSINSIAMAFHISPIEILRNNSLLTYPYDLHVGDELVISYKGKKLRSIETNGYAYVYISEDSLRKVLPFLTYLSVFSYGFDVNGQLLPLEDEAILKITSEYKTRPIFVLSNLDEQEEFSSERASLLLNDEALQEIVINNVMQYMKEKNYRGLDVDFEYLRPEDREAYIAFLQKITQRAHENGYFVFVALAPKTSAEQQGILYEAHDYSAIGSIVDGVLLMTYEYGYSYSEPMAVSPVDKVRQVLDYAVTAIPSDKIFLGMPNYGYDWILPLVQGEAANVVTNAEAVELAAWYGAEIQFDKVAQSPFFVYTDEDGRAHEVWFQDARSVFALGSLIEEYNLRGVGVWNVMTYFPQIWLVLNSLYDIII